MATSSTVRTPTATSTNPYASAANAFSPTSVGQPTGQEQTLSNWAAPYITDMLAKTRALSETPYQTYRGPLTAAASPLQIQAFQGLGGLSIPRSVRAAARTAGDVANVAGRMSYDPTRFRSGYAAPTPYDAATAANDFTATSPYQEGQFTNTFQGQGAYTPTTGSFTQQGVAGQYMNPFIQQALQPQLEELNRQAQIQQMQNASRMAKAGSFGGGRQAILDAELQRNLMQQTGRTTGEAYATAFDKAQAQFNAEQQRKMQEAQFGATQGMTGAELAARYGSDAQKAFEQSRQFRATQALENARLAAQYGLSGRQLAEQSRQFRASQAAESARLAAQFRLDAQRAAEQSRQFGAGYGLDALRQRLAAAQAQGNLGGMESDIQRANIASQLAGGAQQRAITGEGIAADYAEYERQRDFPYKQLQFQQSMLQNMPFMAANYAYQEPSGFSKLLTAAGGLEGLYRVLFPNAPATGGSTTTPTATPAKP